MGGGTSLDRGLLVNQRLFCESAVKQVLEARQEAYREAKSLGS